MITPLSESKKNILQLYVIQECLMTDALNY